MSASGSDPSELLDRFLDRSVLFDKGEHAMFGVVELLRFLQDLRGSGLWHHRDAVFICGDDVAGLHAHSRARHRPVHAGDESIASSMPCDAADPSLCSSFFTSTVTAGPANFVGDSGRMSCDIYPRWPYNCSIASETDATSTVRKPSITETSAGCAMSQAVVAHAAATARVTVSLIMVVPPRTFFEAPRVVS